MGTLRTSAAGWGVAVALILITAASLVPFLTGWRVLVDLPPLHAEWNPRVGLATVPAVVLAGLAARFAIDLARQLAWRLMLLVVVAASAAWMIVLALVDGAAGLGSVLEKSSEYLGPARSVTDVWGTLHGYVARIPLDSADHWPVHLAGHPPGALLFFVGLVHLGLGTGVAAGLVIIALAATTPAAVLVTLRRLGAEGPARAAAPFLAFGSAAIWMAVSADAMFGAVAAWGLCLLAIAATSRTLASMIGWSVGAGLLLGYCVLLSYGLPLLGVLAVAILWISRGWRALPGAIVGAVAVVAGFAAAGFAWWEAYPVLVQRYYDGIAAHRPYSYWVWANLAALAVCAGPLVGASIAVVGVKARRWRDAAGGDRTIVLLVAAAVISIVLADVSGMSKAEVERIWLPFVPWLLLGTALLPERWRRIGLIGQLVFALLVQHLLDTTW